MLDTLLMYPTCTGQVELTVNHSVTTRNVTDDSRGNRTNIYLKGTCTTTRIDLLWYRLVSIIGIDWYSTGTDLKFQANRPWQGSPMRHRLDDAAHRLDDAAHRPLAGVADAAHRRIGASAHPASASRIDYHWWLQTRHVIAYATWHGPK